ncbi:hypothetical protein [Halioxenophilus sp. WMMB6]|uniref:hypothetical protein n=1 Tax=Halioxenophilus sp. WMMB6 TaxID=3073815 RepID=UPI00295EFDA7|nr:hypothetical protein [Halioxenophilus sp. WMMB6]
MTKSKEKVTSNGALKDKGSLISSGANEAAVPWYKDDRSVLLAAMSAVEASESLQDLLLDNLVELIRRNERFRVEHKSRTSNIFKKRGRPSKKDDWIRQAVVLHVTLLMKETGLGVMGACKELSEFPIYKGMSEEVIYDLYSSSDGVNDNK